MHIICNDEQRKNIWHLIALSACSLLPVFHYIHVSIFLQLLAAHSSVASLTAFWSRCVFGVPYSSNNHMPVLLYYVLQAQIVRCNNLLCFFCFWRWQHVVPRTACSTCWLGHFTIHHVALQCCLYVDVIFCYLLPINDITVLMLFFNALYCTWVEVKACWNTRRCYG